MQARGRLLCIVTWIAFVRVSSDRITLHDTSVTLLKAFPCSASLPAGFHCPAKVILTEPACLCRGCLPDPPCNNILLTGNHKPLINASFWSERARQNCRHTGWDIGTTLQRCLPEQASRFLMRNGVTMATVIGVPPDVKKLVE